MEKTSDQLQSAEARDVSEAVEEMHLGPRYTPAVDIFEAADTITVLADMPGVRSESLQVDLREGTLTLQGKVDQLEAEGETDVLREYTSGTFFRQFRLADTIDQNRIDARLVDGVLTLILPKTREAMPRQITIRSA